MLGDWIDSLRYLDSIPDVIGLEVGDEVRNWIVDEHWIAPPMKGVVSSFAFHEPSLTSLPPWMIPIAGAHSYTLVYVPLMPPP